MTYSDCNGTESTSLSKSDRRTVQRLVENCRDLGDDCSAWMRCLVNGFISIHGLSEATAGQFEIPRVELDDDATSQAAFFLPSAIDITTIMENLRVLAANRSPRLSCGSESPAVLGDQLTAYASIGNGRGRFVVIFIHQPGGKFDDRAVATVEYALELVAPLVGLSLAGFRDKRPSDLPPRVQQVLGCLLVGDGAKKTATKLGISVNTVNQYATTLFTFFGVKSRAELMARWIARGWKPHVIRKKP
jgi:DNA-binding CsgD family transcriptional regulator